MKITALTSQQKDKNRVNVLVDGVYRFSLDIYQVADLGLRVGREYTEQELIDLEIESQFGKLYGRALEYTMMRPHSSREIRDYLYKKTQMKRVRSQKTGEVQERPGVSVEVSERVYDRLLEKGYIDDEKFARYWIENRNLRKGSSRRKLEAELRTKGVKNEIIAKYLDASERDDQTELQKIITKRRGRYPDEQKFMQYLARQGFSYDDIKSALNENVD